MPVYIEKINGDVDRPTNRQGEYRAICLFRKLGNRKKAEICNIVRWNAHTKLMAKSDNERFPMDLSQSTHVSDVVSVESDNDD